MASLFWYRFSGCCDTVEFQIQASSPPYTFVVGSSYYVSTDFYEGCAEVISIGFTPGVSVFSLKSADSTQFGSCASCIGSNPCPAAPSITPSYTAKPTSTPSNTATNTYTPTITPTTSATQTPTVTPTNTSTPTYTPTNTLTPTNSATVSPTPSVTTSETPTYTPTASETPTNTPTSTVTSTYTPTASITPSVTNTLTSLPNINCTPGPSSTPTQTYTPTITSTPSTACTYNSFCLYSNFSATSIYDGTYFNYGFYNNKSLFYGPDTIGKGFIYFNTGDSRWCLSTCEGGECILFGPTKSTNACPDLDSGIFGTSCPSPTPTCSGNACAAFDFSAVLDCITISGLTPTQTQTNTMTPSVTQTVTPTQYCINKSVSVSGSTFYFPNLTPTPSSTLAASKNCVITDQKDFTIFESVFSSQTNKLLTDCRLGKTYIVSEIIPFNTGATFNAVIDYKPVCVTYTQDVFSPSINVLQSIQSGNLFECRWCAPFPSSTPTQSVTVTPTITPTITYTPSSTPCVSTGIDFKFVVGKGIQGNPTYVVSSIVQQSDNKLLISGSFSGYNGNQSYGIIRVSSTGSYDYTFDSSLGFSGSSFLNMRPNRMSIQKDGKIICVGYFTSYSGINQNYICRLNTDGTLDTSFAVGVGFNSFVTNVGLQSDGKIICVGYFTSYNGNFCNRICRLNSDGTFDNTFTTGSGLSAAAFELKILSDDSILICGGFSSYNGTSANRIIKLLPTGVIDASFVYGSGFNNTTNRLDIDNDGNVYVIGSFTTYDGTTVPKYIVKLDKYGSVDSTFSSNLGAGFTTGGPTIIKIGNYNEIYVGCATVTVIGGINYRGIFKISTDGIISTNFVPSVGFYGGYPQSLFIDNSGNVVVGGTFTTYDSLSFPGLVKLKPCQ